MSDGYNMKISLDARAATREVKSFSDELNSSLKALREFDSRSKSAFKALDQFSKINTSGLTRSMKQIDSAVRQLNQIKVNKGVVNSLNGLRVAVNGIRFSGGNSLKKLPEALSGLDNIKISNDLIDKLNNLKGAMKGFRGPPKSLGSWAPTLNPIGQVKIGSALAQRLTELKVAMRGFGGPSKSAMNLPKFLKELTKYRVSPALANNLGTLKTALQGFSGPSARAGTNLASLINAMKGANPQQIAQVAAALQKLHGISFNIGRALSQVGQNGQRGMTAFQRATMNARNAMSGLFTQTNMVSSAISALSAAFGGMSIIGFAKSVYTTGAAWQSLQRTLGAVSTSASEVQSHLNFINDLTTRMPISVEAAADSYRKFAVAARLSGLSIKDTQEVFENFSTGFSAMGLSAESQKYAFIALEQIISKGAVQMEELKTQLGDHLPGAVQILADSLDVPVNKLMKMIEAGEVTSDAIIKMGKTVKAQFGDAAAAAVNSTQGQFVRLENSWTRFKKTIFDNNFDSALGAMANRLAAIMDSDAAQKFAADVGNAFQRAFKAVAVVAEFLAQNKDTVIAFFKAFAGYSIVVAATHALRLFAAPLSIMQALVLGTASAVMALGRAFAFLASGKALQAVMTFFSFFTKRMFFAVAAALVLARGVYKIIEALDYLAGTDMAGSISGIGNDMVAGAQQIVDSLMGMGEGAFDGMTDSAAEFEKQQKAIAEQNILSEKIFAQNAAKEQKRDADKLKALSDKEQKLWEELNPIGKANEEYARQLKMLDEIAKKRGLTDDQKAGFKRVLDAQTLEERNPLGEEVRGLREELAAAKAKTAEQRAFNDAKKFEYDMLKKGVALSKEQVRIAQDYYEGIAKMNGELGNGIERWAASVGDFNDNMHEAVKDSIGDLSSELAAFATGAEADFGKLAQSILQKFAKIALDSMFKDIAGAMGMDGEKNGASAAEAALEKLGSIGDTINTAMTNVYTSGLTVDGKPIEDLLGGTELRGPLGPNGQGAGLKGVQDTPLRGSQPMLPNGDRSGHDFSKTQPGVDRNPTFTPEAEDWKWRLQQEEAARIGQFDQNTAAMAGGPVRVNNADIQMPPMRGSLPMVQGSTVNVDPVQTGALGGGMPVPTNGVGISLSEKEIVDLKKTLATEWVTKAGDMQGKGIIDTILNRKASGKWGNTIEDVVNARSQFSDVNSILTDKKGRNTIDEVMIGRDISRAQYGKSSALVDDWLAQRAGGAPSSVGDHLNYANPNYSSKKNLPWINALDGPQYGVGKAIHNHGTVPELQKYRPGNFGISYPGMPQPGTAGAGVQPVDPTVTNSISQANAELSKTASTMQQVTTATQTANTQQQSSAQQAQMASQQKVMANQTETMSTQQAALGMQQAGMSAQQAGPQFTQAGTQISQAGMQAQQAGTAAATAQPGLGSFGSGITGLLGPLASAVPGLGQFGSAIISLLGSLGSPMGGLMGGLFSEGGYATSPVATGSLPGSAWSGAPHYAEGTANTSGGMPAILHPNEAVIPLSRGRSIPVDLGDNEPRAGRQENLDGNTPAGKARPVFNVNITTPDPNAFRKSRRQIQLDMASAYQRSLQRQ